MEHFYGRPARRSTLSRLFSTLLLPLLLFLLPLWLGVHDGGVLHTAAFGFFSRLFGRSKERTSSTTKLEDSGPFTEEPVWLVMRVERRRFYHWSRRFGRPKFEFDERLVDERFRVLRMTCYALKATATRRNFNERRDNVTKCFDMANQFARQNGSPGVRFYTYEVAERYVPDLAAISLRQKIADASGGMEIDANNALGAQSIGNGAIFVRCQPKSKLDPTAWNCLGTKDGVDFLPSLADQYEGRLQSLPANGDNGEHPGLLQSRESDATFEVGRRMETDGDAVLDENPSAHPKVLRPFRYSTEETTRKTRVVVVKLGQAWEVGRSSDGFPLYRKVVTKKRLPKGGNHVTLECYIGTDMSVIAGCFGCFWREAIKAVVPQKYHEREKDSKREKTRIFITARNPLFLRAFLRESHNSKYKYIFEGKWPDELHPPAEPPLGDSWPVLRAPLAASLWTTYIRLKGRRTSLMLYKRNEINQEITDFLAFCEDPLNISFKSDFWNFWKSKAVQPQATSTENEEQFEDTRTHEPLEQGVARLTVSLFASEFSINGRVTQLDNHLDFDITIKEEAAREYNGNLHKIVPVMTGCSTNIDSSDLENTQVTRIQIANIESLSFRSTKLFNPPAAIQRPS